MEMINKEVLFRNNTGSKSKESIIEGFVIRIDEFEHILERLRQSDRSKDAFNAIIIGQRGSGKTTLIHRVNYALTEESKLSNRYLPILFSEEQYNLSDLTNLWESIAASIEDNFSTEKITERINEIIDSEHEYERLCFEYLRNFLVQQEMTAILFIENLNFFLGKLSKDESERLKSILTSDSPFRIIGSSTSYNDGGINFDDPFYSFLEIVPLDGLSQKECKNLLVKIGQQYGEEDHIKAIMKSHPGRVESLRRLTGGVPRTMSYLFQIFLDNENGKAIKDLYLLIDTLTLLYKSELDQLSTQQQKVIDSIARRWDAISVKEIAKKTRLESKNVSSILSYLERNQIVEKIPTSKKNHLYSLKDRFMNIWYLMRFGRKHDKDNVIWLVRFFDAWCDESELTKRIKKHIDDLKGGKYDEIAAIDMGNTFLSCENVSEELKEEIIKTTNSILPDRIFKHTRTKRQDLLSRIKTLVNEGKLEEAEKRLEEVDEKTVDYYTLATSVFLMLKNPDKALENAKAAWELDDTNSLAAISMGLLYEFEFGDIDKAIHFYNTSLELPQPHPYAANRLGQIYKDREDYEVAIEYHKKAASKNIKPSLKSLGEIYLLIKQFNKAQSYLEKAIAAKIDGASTVLAKVFTEQGKQAETERALQIAVDLNEEGANLNLGRFYLSKKRPSFKKAENQFKVAIKKGISEGYSELGKLHIKKDNINKAIEILEKGVLHEDAESAHHLGHLYHIIEEFDNSDRMFSKAMELGDYSIIGCWVKSIYSSKRGDKKVFAKELLEKNKESIYKNIHFNLLYAKILLWNEEVSESTKIIYDCTKEIFKSFDEESRSSRRALAELVDYFVLLIGKKEYKIALDIFENSDNSNFKTMLKPVYYLLMEELKETFPTEYLKAGRELKETIDELRREVENVRLN